MRELSVRPRYLYRILIPVFFFLASVTTEAQHVFDGKVLDANTGQPVNVFVLHADSVNHPFSGGTFHLQTTKTPAQLIFKANGYFPFAFDVSSKTSFITIHLIPENIDIQEVKVRAFSSEKRLADTPGAIALITGQQLMTEPTFTLAPTVNNVPGVWMQSGSMNTNRLTIRGIGSRSPYGSNKIRAYYGEMPLTNGVGETTLEDLDLEQISNIEVIKGPSSGFYGAGLGGVLLFNPAKPSKTGVDQQVSVGSFQTEKSSTKLALAGKDAGHSLVYSFLHSNGYRENNETNRHNVTWTSSVTKKNTKVDLLGMFIKMDAYIPSSVDLKTFRETPWKAASNWLATRGYEDYTTAFAGVSVQQSFNKNWRLKVGTFGHYNKNNELRPFNILRENNHYLGFRSVLEKKYTSGTVTMRLLLGDEFFAENYLWQTLENNNRAAGALLSDNRELRRYNNMFFLTDFNFQDKFLISASINRNQTNYDYKDLFLSDGDQSGNRRFNPVVSPRLAATWVVSEKFRLYSVISHGFSPPTLEETLMPNGQRNPAIKPETGWNFEVGTKSTFFNSVYFELSAYYMKIRNLLVARRTAEDAYMGINAGSTNHPGLEVKLDYKFLERRQVSAWFHMSAALTDYRFASFIDSGNDYSGNKLTGSPSSTSNWMLEARHVKGFFLNLYYQTVGRIPITDSNSVFTDAYSLFNFMAGYEKSFNHLSLSLMSGIQNLFDTHYASMVLINATAFGNQSPRYYYPGLPRNFKSMLSLKYWF